MGVGVGFCDALLVAGENIGENLGHRASVTTPKSSTHMYIGSAPMTFLPVSQVVR